MPNSIKYSTTGDTQSLKKGNLFFGVGDVGKGPSSVTQHFNGVTPMGGGYTIYFYIQDNQIISDMIQYQVTFNLLDILMVYQVRILQEQHNVLIGMRHKQIIRV